MSDTTYCMKDGMPYCQCCYDVRSVRAERDALQAKLDAVSDALDDEGDPVPPGAIKDAWTYSCGWHDALYHLHLILHPPEASHD